MYFCTQKIKTYSVLGRLIELKTKRIRLKTLIAIFGEIGRRQIFLLGNTMRPVSFLLPALPERFSIRRKIDIGDAMRTRSTFGWKTVELHLGGTVPGVQCSKNIFMR